MKELLKQRTEQLSILLDNKQQEQFINYYHILIEWNKIMNLTAITEYEEAVEKHFIDSLSVIKAADLSQLNKVIDIGTGAGFPGIPLKIVFPQLDITLLDSLNKRIKFLEEVINKLELNKIKVIHGRAEEYARKEDYREKYDLCVSRAVANLSTLSEYCIPFIKKEGLFISYKSGDIDSEITKSKKAIRILGGKIDDVIKFKLPETEISRSFIVIKKEKNTDKKYPRKSGVPSKEPL